MRPDRLLLLFALGLLAGCSKHVSGPAATQAPLPPALVATQPVARATGVLYDGEIWGQFDRPLDPSTVDDHSVFLKLDGQRIPIDVSYEAITRRIVLKPTVVLELQRTYTVDFSPAVHDADGVPLADGVYFQFTTNSLRRVPYDYPAAGALEGPLTSLGWNGSQTLDGNLFYEIYASEDSSDVELRRVPFLQRSVFTRFVPTHGWRPGSRVFWAITSENLTTGERLTGPMRSFRVLEASLPEDSVTLAPRDWGSNDLLSRNTQYCTRNTMPSGPRFNAAIHWDYALLPAGVRVTGARMSVSLVDTDTGKIPSSAIGAWMTQNDWSACSIVAPGPPFHELSGLLADAVQVSGVQADFAADRLGAFVEAQARGRTMLPGLVVRSAVNLTFHSPLATDPTRRPRLTVRFQRLPAGVAR